MAEPVIVVPPEQRADPKQGFTVSGATLAIQEWVGSAPAELHVHHSDDVAWHVLEGTLRFAFGDREVDVPPGSTVFVPAGVPHTYGWNPVDVRAGRYLVIGPPRVFALFDELISAVRRGAHGERAAIYAKYDAELLPDPGRASGGG